MSDSFLKKLAFILLILFCGQALATPFLNCCEELDGSNMHDSSMQHSALDMHKSHHEKMPSNSSFDCNQLCDFCAASILSLAKMSKTVLKNHNALFNAMDSLFIPFSNLEKPFRPPIFS